MRKNNFHENLIDRKDVKIGSEKSFGIIISTILILIGGWQYWEGNFGGYIFLGLGFALLILALVFPILLRPFNLVWFKFGLFLNRIFSPIITGMLFFLVISPIGLIIKIFNKDPLHLKFDPNTKSYWINRNPPGPDPETLKYQF